MGDDIYRAGACDPYNTATTSAKWATALRERNERRRKLVAAFLVAIRDNIHGARDVAKLFLNRAFGRMLRGR